MALWFSPKNGLYNGIFAYVNRHYSSNFHEFINTVGSSNIDDQYGNIEEIFPPRENKHIVIGQENASYTFTFKNFSINITHYSIKSSTSKERYLKSWKIEGSYKNSSWQEIDDVSECNDCYINSNRHYSISNHQVFDSFRITKYHNNSDDTAFFDLYGFEVFGTICNTFNCDLIKSQEYAFNTRTIRDYLPYLFIFLQ